MTCVFTRMNNLHRVARSPAKNRQRQLTARKSLKICCRFLWAWFAEMSMWCWVIDRKNDRSGDNRNRWNGNNKMFASIKHATGIRSAQLEWKLTSTTLSVVMFRHFVSDAVESTHDKCWNLEFTSGVNNVWRNKSFHQWVCTYKDNQHLIGEGNQKMQNTDQRLCTFFSWSVVSILLCLMNLRVLQILESVNMKKGNQIAKICDTIN